MAPCPPSSSSRTTTRIFGGVLTALLSAEGYTVLSAANGGDALIIAERERPDLILSDVLMPNRSGFELAVAVRAWEDGHGPPILLMSTEPPPRLPERTGFIRKPFDIDRLLRAVDRLFRDAPPAVEPPCPVPSGRFSGPFTVLTLR